VARLAERGWHLRTGIEPEFFLLRQQMPATGCPPTTDRLDKPSYDLKSLPRQRASCRPCSGAGGRRPDRAAARP
jgi:glutamine synthetase